VTFTVSIGVHRQGPGGVGFSMEDRATGDFLAWLQVNPNSARKKLEAVMLTLFPPNDIPEAPALRAGPYIADRCAAGEFFMVFRKFGQARRYRSAKVSSAQRLYSAATQPPPGGHRCFCVASSRI